MQKIYYVAEECECNSGFFAYFQYANKKYCSNCYQMKGGKMLSKLPLHMVDDINEIFFTLISVFNYNKHANKALIMCFKRCKNKNDFQSLFEKIYNQENNIYILSNEASIIIKIIESSMLNNKDKIKLQHLTCARVIDYWNMTTKDHKMGPCYYGNFGDKPNLINESIIFIKANTKNGIRSHIYI